LEYIISYCEDVCTFENSIIISVQKNSLFDPVSGIGQIYIYIYY